MDTLNLPRLVRERNPRRKSIKLRPVEVTNSLETDLYASYRDVVESWRKFVKDVLLPSYELPPAPLIADANGEQLQAMIDQQGMVVYQTAKLGRWVTRFGEWHTGRLIKAAESATGMEIAPYLRMADIQEELQAAIRQNVALLSSFNAEVKKKVEQIIFQGLVLRKNKATITKELSAAMGITQRRARFIAGDQTHKLNSVLTRLRYQQLGFESYLWRTRRDNRVRKEHRSREGRRFLWSKPPSDGHPGWPIACRCVAEAYAEW